MIKAMKNYAAKNKRIAMFCLLFMISCIFSGCVSNKQKNAALEHKPFSAFVDYVETNGGDNLSLSIYYFSADAQTYGAISEKRLINQSYELKINIPRFERQFYEDLLVLASQATLEPATEEGYEDVRVCLIIETNRGVELLRVTMWDSEHNMIVNGVAVKEVPEFIDLVAQLLPSYEADILRNWRPWGYAD